MILSEAMGAMPPVGELAIEPAPFDLWSTVEGVLRRLRNKADAKGLDLRIRYALAAPPFLVGDRDGIHRVLGCLVGDAVECAKCGQIVVDVQGNDCPDNAAAMRLRVEPSEIDGTHLSPNLGPCEGMVERIGGRIGALDRPGGGSFVWLALTLPIDAARHERHW